MDFLHKFGQFCRPAPKRGNVKEALIKLTCTTCADLLKIFRQTAARPVREKRWISAHAYSIVVPQARAVSIKKKGGDFKIKWFITPRCTSD